MKNLRCGCVRCAMPPGVWNNIPLKKARFNNEFLYVSNYRKEIRIPLSSIDDVRASVNPWFRRLRTPAYRVIITLKESSEFGSKILIIPGFYYKDVVEQLSNAIAASRPIPAQMRQSAFRRPTRRELL